MTTTLSQRFSFQKLPAAIRRNAACLLSFVIPLAVMLGIFIINGVFPFGDESFMHSDMYHQYVPFLSEMQRKLKSGDSLFYSWNVGIGSNFLALYGYYMASPFNWLVFLVPGRYLIEFMTYLVALKIGLCGFTFCFYLIRHFHKRSVVLVPFAVFYALSGYLAAYNWNVMWLDCIWLFPLIALGLEALVREGKYKLYCISLALCILSNYYISIMVCIFLVLYFLLQLFCSRLSLKRMGAAAARFALFSTLAGGMAAVILIPEYAALHLTEFSEINFPDTLSFYFSFLDMIARHCMNVAVETGLDHWPNIYCGVAVFLLVPLYVANGRISLREKAANIGLLVFLLLSFSTNMLNFIWHGLNWPDSLPCRQSFLYIFLLLTLCAKAVLYIRDCSLKALGVCFCLSLGFVLLFEKLMADEEAYRTETFLLTALFLCLYGVFLYFYHTWTSRAADEKIPAEAAPYGETEKKAGKRSRLRLLAVLTLTAVTTEAAVNTYITSCSVTSRSSYLNNLDSYQSLVMRTRERDGDFYRFEKTSRVTKNDGTLVGYPTASLFSSTANGHVEEFYDKMGMSDSKVFYCFDGATPLSSSILGVRYMFSRSGSEDPALYTLIDQEGDIYLYECRYSLPLGFMINAGAWSSASDVSDASEASALDELLGDIDDTRTDELEQALDVEGATPLDTQNRMVQALGLEQNLFTSVGAMEEADGAATITADMSGHYYAYVGDSSVDTLKMESEAGSKTFSKLKYHYICDLGWHDAGDVISLASEDSSDLNVSAYRLDFDVMDAVISVLGEQTMTVDSYSSTRINGHINVSREGELILSVAYEPGWTILVDGEEVQPGLFDDTFISLSLTTGEHTIEMRYRPAGLTIGIAVSLICLAVFVTVVLLECRRRHAGLSEGGGNSHDCGSQDTRETLPLSKGEKEP
ncbi:MAG TPA: YfhO family protein [Candidatus Eisenbergiella merdipullorum]|uniref:YfhO family protein n=1 Tax=Candidatus Eisenbergiella merdipullorum TaxID=2838553 RepID=A0A9D2L0A6_9FIRM|nr:YfhO family protein [Candidatus Eisenbergiella merdipullorum]